MSTLAREGLRPADFALLGLLCLGLFGFTMAENQVLTTHEAVHCQNVREMWASHDWIIPTYGGRPWLERPPLPDWGLMLSTLRQSIYVVPLVCALPGVAIFITSICCNLVSDGLRAAMDVRM